MVVQYKLLGNYVNPVNSREITLEISHDQESVINQPKPHVGINNLYFAREDIQTIMDYIATSPGCLTEGIPFDIEIKEKGVTETINMYLNLMEGFKRSNDGIEASVKMLQSLDHLDDRIDGFTFESMYNETPVSFTLDSVTYTSYQQYFDRKCIFIPYVLSSIPNNQAAFNALATIISIAIQWFRALVTIVQWTIQAAGVFTTIPGILQLAAEIAFFALLTLALIALINQLINCLIQPIKYHGAMLLTDMLKIVCHKLGLKFNSSIWNVAPYNEIAYLPDKYNPKEENPNTFTIFGIPLNGFQQTGFTSPGYAYGVHDSMTPTDIQKGYMNGTGGDSLRLTKKFCNGKIIIPDQTSDLVLERRDFYPAGTPYQLPDIRQDWNGYNTDELFANILIRFADDLNDKNCIDKYIGTILQATHSQIITTNAELVNLKGLREIDIPAARGVVKINLTFIEKLVNSISFIFAPQNFNNRKGCLLLENDMVTTPKLLWVDLTNANGASSNRFTQSTMPGNLGQDRIAYLRIANGSVINAKWLWDHFYFIDAFVPDPNVVASPQHNRFTKISPALNKDSEKNPFILSLADFKNLVSNPKLKDNFAEEVIADTIQWRIGDESGRAEIEFRKAGWLKNPQSNNGATRATEININLQIKTSIPNGQ